MSYQGDIRLGATLEFTFTTRRFTTGVPFTLAGTPSIEAYQVGSSTPITAGITLTVDYSGVTGLNHVSIAATGGNGFATAKDVSVVIAAGTVDSVSVVGETIASFSIENRSGLMPTTAGRTLDVAATGEAGLDFNNVLSSSLITLHSLTVTGAVTLSSTLDVTGATTFTGNVAYSNGVFIQGGAQVHALSLSAAAGGDGLRATGNTTGNGINAIAGATGIGARLQGGGTSGAGLAATNTSGATVTSSGLVTLDSVTVTNGTTFTGTVLATNASNDIRGVLLSGTQTFNLTGNITGNLSGSVGSVTGAVGAVTGNVGGNVTGSVGSVAGNVGGNVVGSVGSVVGAVGSVTGAVGSVTGNVGGNVVGTVAGVTPSTAAQVAAVLTTQITEAYRANGAAPTLAEFMCEVLGHLGEVAIVGTTKTLNQLDHTTPAETYTLDSATTPSSITRAT